MKPMKRRHPLQVIWKAATVSSRSDGRLTVYPQWQSNVHGVLDRLYAARQLEKAIRAILRGRR